MDTNEATNETLERLSVEVAALRSLTERLQNITLVGMSPRHKALVRKFLPETDPAAHLIAAGTPAVNEASVTAALKLIRELWFAPIRVRISSVSKVWPRALHYMDKHSDEFRAYNADPKTFHRPAAPFSIVVNRLRNRAPFCQKMDSRAAVGATLQALEKAGEIVLSTVGAVFGEQTHRGGASADKKNAVPIIVEPVYWRKMTGRETYEDRAADLTDPEDAPGGWCVPAGSEGL